MKFLTLASMCFWLLNNVELFCGEDVVICYHRDNPVRTIDCGSDAIIQIHSITAANVQNTFGCNPTNVINVIAGKNEDKKINMNPSVGCHGSQRCDIAAFATEVRIPGTILYTNVLHIRYDCFQLTKTSVARLPLYREVVARNLHTFSPDYPDTTPKGTYSFQCVVTPVRIATHLNVMIERLQISDLGQCFEQLHLSENTTFCSNVEQNVYKHEIVYENGTLTIFYEKVEGASHQGGYFWLHVTGFQDREPVDLKITCPDQSNVPGYSTTPRPLTTVTTTVTATTVATTATVTSEGPDSGIANNLGDEKPSGTEMLAVLITVVIIIFIVGIVILLLILKIRKRSGQKGNQCTSENLPGAVNEGNLAVRVSKERISNNYGANTYSFVHEEHDDKIRENQKSTTTAKDRKKSERDEVYETVEKNTDLTYAVVDKEKITGHTENGENRMDNVRAMYAVVDKDKRRKIDHIDNDEVVVFENDDLYADGAESNNKDQNSENEGDDYADEEMYAVVDKDKTKTTQNTDADETVICENDDLYDTEPTI